MWTDRDSFVVETKPGQSDVVAIRIANIVRNNGCKDIEVESVGQSFVSLSGKNVAVIVPQIEQLVDVIEVTRKPELQIAPFFTAVSEPVVKRYILKLDDQHIGPGFKDVAKALVDLGKDEPLLKMGDYLDSPGIQFIEAPESLKAKLEKIPGVYEVEEIKPSILFKKPSGPNI